MTLLEISLKRINLFLNEIERLRKIEFAYDDSLGALLKLKNHFQKHKALLESLSRTKDSTIIERTCASSLHDLFLHLPLLGFILRSTNVRNAFEWYRPLIRLSNKILNSSDDDKVHLIISSEWNYSPYTYRPIPAFPNYIFIGLPAHESGNPLLIPMFGHELGHHVWIRKKISPSITQKVTDVIYDRILANWDEYKQIYPTISKLKKEEFFSNLYTYGSWSQARSWSICQAEETFCDFIGLRVFGKAYLYAFAYFIAPNLSGRSPNYPTIKTRITNLLNVCDKFGVECDAESYLSMFTDSSFPQVSAGDVFQLKICDEALPFLVDDLSTIAEKSINVTDIVDDDERDAIVKRFNNVIPAENVKSLVNIVNAAWEFYEENKEPGVIWKSLEHLTELQHEQIFDDLVLKTIEVFEIDQIIKGEDLQTEN